MKYESNQLISLSEEKLFLTLRKIAQYLMQMLYLYAFDISELELTESVTQRTSHIISLLLGSDQDISP